MARFVSANANWIRTGVLAPWLGEPDDNVVSSVITAELTSDAETKDIDLVNKTLMCLPLNFKHGSAAKVACYNNNDRRFQSRIMDSSAKRARIMEFTKYDRLVEMADLNDGNRCFVVIYKESSKAIRSLANCTDIPLLGTPCMIGSPTKSPGRLAMSGLTRVNSEFPLVPLTNLPDDIKQVLPEVPLARPSKPGELVYFIKHNAQIEIPRFSHITASNVTCTGKMCDRSRIMNDTNVSCGCLNNGLDKRATVGEMTVVFDVPISVDVTGKAEVEQFRSQRLTELLVENNKALQVVDAKEILKKHIKHEKKIKDIVQYVNNNDAWTLVGWFRIGEVKDASNESVSIESQETKLHLSLLVPTNKDVRDLKDVTFNGMRITGII